MERFRTDCNSNSSDWFICNNIWCGHSISNEYRCRGHIGCRILTGINGLATVIEAGTDYNFFRDGVFQGNEIAYNWYSGTAEAIAIIGSMVLGVYHMTGQYKAARCGQEMLGKGYRKAGPNRWISKDGFGQLRLDDGHFNYEIMENIIQPKVRNTTLLNFHIYFHGFLTSVKIGGIAWALF